MTEELIRKTEHGDVSGFPGIQDILGQMGVRGGWDGVHETPAAKAMQESLADKRAQLERDYQATFDTVHGRRVLEDLFDQTLRRAPVAPSKDKTLEQLVPYVLERNGQNSTAFYVCKMVDKGRRLGPAGAKKKKKSA